MKLNDELFVLGKNSVGICKVIDSDYVLVSKKMPVSDNQLNDYINAIKDAKNNGINICEIVDYKLIDGTTSTFNNGVSYSKGVFIEDRAKGNSFTFNHFHLNEENKKEIIDGYMSSITNYIEEIEKRSEADISIYDKLIEDMLNLSQYNLEVDPKPTNFFFDSKKGYTIIDVIPMTKLGKNEFFNQYLKSIVFGYGIPHIYLDNNDVSMMPIDLYNRYKNSIKILIAKIETSLLKHNFKLDNSFDYIINEKDPNIVDYVDIYDYIDNRIEEHNKFKI